MNLDFDLQSDSERALSAAVDALAGVLVAVSLRDGIALLELLDQLHTEICVAVLDASSPRASAGFSKVAGRRHLGAGLPAAFDCPAPGPTDGAA